MQKTVKEAALQLRADKAVEEMEEEEKEGEEEE